MERTTTAGTPFQSGDKEPAESVMGKPSSLEVISWGTISSCQYAGLFGGRRHDEQFLRELLPEGGEKGIDKSLSLGLCRGDTVIGWLVVVRIRSDLIEYSALYVEPKYRSSGAAVLLLGEAFLRLAAARVEHVIFQVKIENDLMLRFVRKRFHPIVSEATLCRSEKLLSVKR
jgi:ribosomal protein S18 acetylase RimI-like enzyme